MRSLLWFRRDLRLHDNKAFFHAVTESASLSAVAFISPGQWRQHHESISKITFYLASLKDLGRRLAAYGVELRVVEIESFAQAAAALRELAVRNNCETVFFNCEYEYNEKKRDEAVVEALRGAGVKCRAFHDRLLIEPGRILTGSGGYYTVFTPFRRSWLGVACRSDLKPLPLPDQKYAPLVPLPECKSESHADGWRADLWPVGEDAAQKRLKEFSASRLEKYQQQRDFPSVDGTSLLSPWLAAGALSPRQCLEALLKVDAQAMKNLETGAGTWLNELIWRDFYSHVLSGFPRVSRSLPFKADTIAIKWNRDDNKLNAWKEGQTGYPIVDAAMRQLKQTGWMHNRLRMVAAMFLSKHLFIDWREGERYFMETLIDGDLAANNGGWQWSASTGTDAVPYFRIFNPFSQSSRFDKDGVFIKKYCPELEAVSAAVLHDPKKLAAAISEKRISYPEQIVDHQEARVRVLSAFKALKG